MFKRVLIATDGSKLSDVALKAGLKLAASVGAEVTIGSLVLGGEGRNFAFLGDGTFVTKPGFGVFLSIGSATGASFAWPTPWMALSWSSERGRTVAISISVRSWKIT